MDRRIWIRNKILPKSNIVPGPRGLTGEGNMYFVRPGVHIRIGDPDFLILGVDRQQRSMTSYSHAAAPHVFGTTANSAA